MPASLGSHAPLSAHPSPPTGADDFRALQKSYPSVDDEPSFALEGDAPRDLVGELIRVGPGKFLGPWQNPVDGDGLVAKIAFDGSGRAMWTARFVETPGFAEERKSGGGAVTRKGVMGTPVGARPGPVKTSGPYRKNIPALGALFGDLTAVQFKNTANTNVVKFQDKLWALWEGGSPFELDPRTLQTRGMFHFGKHVTADMGFTAHPKIVRDGGAGGRTMVAIAVDFRRMALPGGSPLTVLELDEDAPAAAVRATRHKLPQAGALVVHDFSVLDEWVVVIVSPVRLNLLKLAAGYSQQDFMSQAAGVTRVFLLPRKGRTEQRLQSFALQDASHVYHHVGAFKTSDGRVVVDAVVLPQLWPLEPQHYRDALRSPDVRGKVERWVLDPVARTVARRRLWGGAYEDPGACELPHTQREHHGATYDVAYHIDLSLVREDGAACEPQTRIVQLSGLAEVDGPVRAKTWLAPPRVYVGEAAFARRLGATHDGDGYVLVPLFDVQRSRGGLAVLEAATMETVSLLWSPSWWPPTFHGSWEGQARARL